MDCLCQYKAANQNMSESTNSTDIRIILAYEQDAEKSSHRKHSNN